MVKISPLSAHELSSPCVFIYIPPRDSPVSALSCHCSPNLFCVLYLICTNIINCTQAFLSFISLLFPVSQIVPALLFCLWVSLR